MNQPADIGALSEAVQFLSPNTQVVEMQPGQTLTYTASSYRVGGASSIDFQANDLNAVIRKSSYRSARGKLPRPHRPLLGI